MIEIFLRHGANVGDYLELTPNDRLNLTPLFLFPFLNF